MHIWRGTRLQRKGDAFDRRFDQFVVPSLASVGFGESEPYCFRRPAPCGRDVIYFNVTHRDVTVFVSYQPRFMDEIDDVYETSHFEGEPRIGLASIMTPKGVFASSRTSHSYKTKSAENRDRALIAIAPSVAQYALPWLASMHDPVRYAAAVPPEGILYFARANEAVGAFGPAKEALEEALSRCLSALETCKRIEEFEPPGDRMLVYAATRLGREPALCALVGKAIGYHPQVTAFPDVGLATSNAG